MLLPDQTFIRLFNPRTDSWAEHFEIKQGVFIAKTPEAEATIKILKINDKDRVLERNVL